uniref:Mitochondrial ribosomal protein S18C n=1 Tax=Aquila chrysaetos chrysaetos TaxID=223781 RepID=A0A663DQC2_AQUCH
MAGQAVAARGPWRRLVPVPLWEQPRRLQHEWRPSPSDQPIQMENPYKEPPKKCVLCGISVDYKNVQACATRSRRKLQKPLKELMYLVSMIMLLSLSQAYFPTKKNPPSYLFTGFMPVMFKDPSFLTDPKICNVKYPE